MSLSLIISIVPHYSGELIAKAAKAAGAGGGTIVMGRGTASNSVIQLLGLGDTSKDIVYNLVPEEIKEKVFESLKKETAQKKSHFGIAYSLSVSKFIKCGCENGGEKLMENNFTHQMIIAIVNKGYADDAMAAARKAGAGGGTIINARGTATEGDAKFFGVELVPEKEMLMILVEKEKSSAVVESIKNLPCMNQKGSGIAFCADAGDFTLLGK